MVGVCRLKLFVPTSPPGQQTHTQRTATRASRSFRIDARFIHDVSVSGTEHGAVVMDGAALDLNLDHHRSAPYANLFTNLNAGLGARVFEASGDVTWGAHSARFATFHNLKGRLAPMLPAVRPAGRRRARARARAMGGAVRCVLVLGPPLPRPPHSVSHCCLLTASPPRARLPSNPPPPPPPLPARVRPAAQLHRAADGRPRRPARPRLVGRAAAGAGDAGQPVQRVQGDGGGAARVGGAHQAAGGCRRPAAGGRRAAGRPAGGGPERIEHPRCSPSARAAALPLGGAAGACV